MAASEADLATLRTFIAQGGRFGVDKQGNPVAAIPDAAPTPAPSSAPQAQARAQERSQRQSQAQADRQARQQRSQQQADTRRQRSETRNAKSARAPLDGLTNWVEGLPTPGGNLALLLILLFFAFAIIPVNGGATRLELIYLVLTGGADLPTNAAGTSGNTQASTPGASDVARGISVGVGAAIGSVLGGGTVLPGIGGGPGLPGLDAGFAPFVPSADLAPSR